jgi:hypothetical protein
MVSVIDCPAASVPIVQVSVPESNVASVLSSPSYPPPRR